MTARSFVCAMCERLKWTTAKANRRKCHACRRYGAAGPRVWTEGEISERKRKNAMGGKRRRTEMAIKTMATTGLGAVARDKRPKWETELRVHSTRPEGGSLCPGGRRSYYLSDDRATVTCPTCLGMLDAAEVAK